MMGARLVIILGKDLVSILLAAAKEAVINIVYSANQEGNQETMAE